MVKQIIANDFLLACISLLLSAVILFLILFHPVMVPLFEYAGSYIRLVIRPSFSNAFSITFIEPLLLLVIAVIQKGRLTSHTSYILLLMACSTFPAVMNCYHLGLNWKAALYLSLMFLLLPFYYEFLLRNMPFYRKINLPNLMLSTLLIMGVLTKIIVGYIQAPIFPTASPVLVGLLSRVGGVNASNHIGGIILMILPIVSSRKLLLLALIFLGLTFSRGVYLTLLIWGGYELIIRRRTLSRPSLTMLSLSGLFLIAILFCIFTTGQNPVAAIISNFIDRLIAFKAIFTNPRLDIFLQAIEITEKSNFLGIGPANFYFGYNLLPISSSFQRYSNAHNIYLTVLSENGPIFLILFLFLCITSMRKAYQKNKQVFTGLSIFMFYGVFNGQLYEAGGGKLSLYDAYYFLYLLATLETVERTSPNDVRYNPYLQYNKKITLSIWNRIRNSRKKNEKDTLTSSNTTLIRSSSGHHDNPALQSQKT